ncbi:hypothetical protein SLEP1_g31807 [Rubroshorea leprosula]|uniref:C2H2-type domain-containing protein n=1 Tax=Rubroshorea leprosula TaxID=152421 RepID=A0AAV5KBC4_9ROSI|nr:hypothetical protein SLEP1_g31807 [Rubroshorea leprosula]
MDVMEARQEVQETEAEEEAPYTCVHCPTNNFARIKAIRSHYMAKHGRISWEQINDYILKPIIIQTKLKSQQKAALCHEQRTSYYGRRMFRTYKQIQNSYLFVALLNSTGTISQLFNAQQS